MSLSKQQPRFGPPQSAFDQPQSAFGQPQSAFGSQPQQQQQQQIQGPQLDHEAASKLQEHYPIIMDVAASASARGGGEGASPSLLKKKRTRPGSTKVTSLAISPVCCVHPSPPIGPEYLERLSEWCKVTPAPQMAAMVNVTPHPNKPVTEDSVGEWATYFRAGYKPYHALPFFPCEQLAKTGGDEEGDDSAIQKRFTAIFQKYVGPLVLTNLHHVTATEKSRKILAIVLTAAFSEEAVAACKEDGEGGVLSSELVVSFRHQVGIDVLAVLLEELQLPHLRVLRIEVKTMVPDLSLEPLLNAAGRSPLQKIIFDCVNATSAFTSAAAPGNRKKLVRLRPDTVLPVSWCPQVIEAILTGQLDTAECVREPFVTTLFTSACESSRRVDDVEEEDLGDKREEGERMVAIQFNENANDGYSVTTEPLLRSRLEEQSTLVEELLGDSGEGREEGGEDAKICVLIPIHTDGVKINRAAVELVLDFLRPGMITPAEEALFSATISNTKEEVERITEQIRLRQFVQSSLQHSASGLVFFPPATCELATRLGVAAAPFTIADGRPSAEVMHNIFAVARACEFLHVDLVGNMVLFILTVILTSTSK